MTVPTHIQKTWNNGKPDITQDWRYTQPMVSRCALCPDWLFEGTALEAIEAQKQHRKSHRRRKQGAAGLGVKAGGVPKADRFLPAAGPASPTPETSA